MTHKIIDTKNLGGRHRVIIVELIPENHSEIVAIQKFESLETNMEEKQLIENYLNFGLGSYSIIELISQNKNMFTLKAFQN